MKISIEDLFEHSLCISIDSGRYSAFSKRWSEYGLPVPRMFHGYDLRTGTYQELEGTRISNSSIKCSFSHAAAVKMAQALGWPFVCIFEDDALPCRSIRKKLELYLSEIPDDADVLRMGIIPTPEGCVPPVSYSTSGGRYVNVNAWGGQSYIVFSRYYDRYDHIFNNVNMNCDDALINHSRKVHGDKCRTWTCKDLLFGQSEPLAGYRPMHGNSWGQDMLCNGEDFKWSCDDSSAEGRSVLGGKIEVANGLPKVIYQFWTGENELTPDRKAGIASSISNLGVPVELVTAETLSSLDLPVPLHPAYEHLSMNHRSDYLRCYFMNFFGGGYADIKQFGESNNWRRCFDAMGSNPDIYICGAKEGAGKYYIALREYDNDVQRKKLLSNGYFICRPHTEFTEEWFRRVTEYLDSVYDSVSRHPATEPFGGPGYPIPWAAVQACIFHRVCVRQYDSDRSRMRNNLIAGVLALPYR